MGKQFVRIGNRWINNLPGVITHAEQTVDYDQRACLQVFFIGENYTRFYLSKPEGNDLLRWLNENSDDIEGIQHLPENYQVAGKLTADEEAAEMKAVQGLRADYKITVETREEAGVIVPDYLAWLESQCIRLLSLVHHYTSQARR